MKCTSPAKSRMDANMQLTFPLFPHKIFSLTIPWLLVKSLTFPWQLSNSLTFPGFPDKWSPCLHPYVIREQNKRHDLQNSTRTFFDLSRATSAKFFPTSTFTGLASQSSGTASLFRWGWTHRHSYNNVQPDCYASCAKCSRFFPPVQMGALKNTNPKVPVWWLLYRAKDLGLIA